MIDKEIVDWNQRGAEKVESIIFKGKRRNWSVVEQIGYMVKIGFIY